MKAHDTTQRVDAFTLIEMVLAIGVMAMVLVVVNSIFFSAVRLRERTLAAVDEAQPTQQTVTIMRRDLQCVMAPSGILSGDFKAGNVSEMNMGQPAAVEMYTTTGALREEEPWADIQKVTYELKPPTVRTTDGGNDLIRSVTRNLLNTVSPDVKDQWMMSDVQDIKFECYDGTQWLDTWDTTMGNTNLPVAVRVSIQLASGPNRQPIQIIVPITSQSSTNQLQTVASTGT